MNTTIHTTLSLTLWSISYDMAMDGDERIERMATDKDDWDKKMEGRKTVRSDKRPLAEERTTAVRRRQEEINAADRVMRTTEAHPDQLAAL